MARRTLVAALLAAIARVNTMVDDGPTVLVVVMWAPWLGYLANGDAAAATTRS